MTLLDALLLVLSAVLVVVQVFKDETYLKHLRFLESRLLTKAGIPTPDGEEPEQKNEIAEDKFVGLDEADPEAVGQAVTDALTRLKNK